MRGKGFLMLPAGVLCVLCLILSGCGNDEGNMPLVHREASNESVTVEMAETENGVDEKVDSGLSHDKRIGTVEKLEEKTFFETTGSFQGWEMITVSSEVDGVIESIEVEIGDRVKKGNLLVKLVDTDYRLNVARAEAALAGARANLENARIEFERKEMLYEDKTIPKSIYDISQTRLDQARAGLRLAEAELELARERLKKTRIVAPVDGSIEKKFRSKGEYIHRMVGYKLVSIVVNDPLKLIFSLPESFSAEVKTGQTVGVAIPSYGDQQFKGKIHAVSPSVDPQTRTIRIEARVNNNDYVLKSGLFAVVYYSLVYGEDLFFVPRDAVKMENGKSKVTVLENGIEKDVPVTIVESMNSKFKITGALHGGETVIIY